MSDSSTQQRHFISMRLIVTSAAVAITACAVLAVGMVAERKASQALSSELEARLILHAQDLALSSSSALLDEFPELTLVPQINALCERQPELVLAEVVDHEGRIQGHADSRRVGSSHVRPEDLQARESVREVKAGEELLANSALLVASAPVTAGGQQIGTAYVGIAHDYIDQILSGVRKAQFVVLGIVLAVGIAAALVLMTALLRPISTLRSGLERIGRGDLDTPIELKDVTEFGRLADTVNQMATELKVAQTEMVEKERLSKEIELARELQGSLLPTEPTEVHEFLIAGSHRAAAEVGGDYYDVIELPHGKIGVAVADVAGKGLGGCLVMSMLSALLRALGPNHDSPSQLLIALDERLSESLRKGSFVTMFYGILDPATGELVYASAGHSPSLIYRNENRRVERQATKGIPLGAVRGGAIRKTLSDQRVELSAGDMLLQFTDGINEAFDTGGKEQFGFDRMEELLATEAAGGCADVLTRQRAVLDEWTGGGDRLDDETLLIVSRERASSKSMREGAGPDSLRMLEQARARGHHLPISAEIGELDQIQDWLAQFDPLNTLPTKGLNILATAVYEACANIAEHGYGGIPEKQFELWWVPVDVPESGYFLIRDHGRPFSADNWVATDFSDPAVWRQGRGFGLDIIHRAMSQVSYGPGTAEGNITILVFDPKLHERPQEDTLEGSSETPTDLRQEGELHG